MDSVFHNLAVLENYDPVRQRGGTDSVSHHDQGLVFGDVYILLGTSIHWCFGTPPGFKFEKQHLGLRETAPLPGVPPGEEL